MLQFSVVVILWVMDAMIYLCLWSGIGQLPLKILPCDICRVYEVLFMEPGV